MFHDFFSALGSDCFDRYPEEIERRNRDAIGKYLVVGMFVALLNLVSDLAMGQLAIAYQPLALVAVLSLCYLAYRRWAHGAKVGARAILYPLLSVPLVASIAIGTLMAPTKVAFTFAVLLPTTVIFVLDRPRNIVIWIASTCALFAVCCWLAKSPELFSYDMSHLFICGPLALGAALFVLGARISNVEQAMMFKSKSDHDALTGVYNRRGGDERIGRLVGAGTRGLLVFVDVDDFKRVNDTYGHDGGDAALRAMGRAIEGSFRASDIVMRSGGDEFVVFAPGLVEPANVAKCVERLRANVDAIELAAMPGCKLTVSLGCVVNDGSYPDYTRLRYHADSLMYGVKQGGKDGFRIDATPYAAA